MVFISIETINIRSIGDEYKGAGFMGEFPLMICKNPAFSQSNRSTSAPKAAQQNVAFGTDKYTRQTLEQSVVVAQIQSQAVTEYKRPNLAMPKLSAMIYKPDSYRRENVATTNAFKKPGMMSSLFGEAPEIDLGARYACYDDIRETLC